MADRSITVRLRLLDQYSAPMKKAAASTRAAGAEISGTLESTAAVAAESGAAAGEGYAAGLNSTMASAGRGAVAEVDAALESTTAVAGEAGATAGRSYAAGLDSSVATAGRGAAAEVDATLQSTAATAGRSGASAGSRFTAGLDSSVAAGARGATASVDRALAESSGPAAASGRRAGTAYSTGLASGVEGGVAKANGALALIGKGGALSAVALVGVTLVKGFQRLNAIDQAKAKLTGLGNSATAVTAIMNDALASVKGTAFGMDEAATTAAGAIAAGLKPGKELQADLKLVADAASIAGTSMADMGSIFNKVATSNKLQGDDIAQISDKGIPIVALLAKTLHKSSAEVVALASAGKINFKQFSDAMQQGVGGAAQQSGKTFNGAMKNLMASLGRIGANLLSGIFPKLQGYATGITNSLASVEKGASSAGSAIGGVLGFAVGTLGTSMKILVSVIGPIASGFAALPGPAKELVLVLGAAALASRLFGSRLSGISTGVGSAVSGMSRFAGAAREVATAQGEVVRGSRGFTAQMGRFGSSIARIGQSVPVVAKMQSAFVTAAAGAERFPRAAGSAAAAVTGLSSAGKGLVAALGGPWGIALAGAGVALMLWQKHQQDAAKAAAQHKQEVEGLTDAIKQDGNTIGEATRKQLVDNLAKNGAIDKAKQYGVSMATLVKAAQGNKEAQDDLRRSLIGTDAGLNKSDTSLMKIDGSYENVSNSALKFVDSVIGQDSATQQGLASAKRQASALDASGKAYVSATEKVSPYERAVKTAADATKAAGTAADALKKGIDGVNNAFLETQANEDGFEAAIDAATASLKQNGKTLDANTEKGRANRSALRDIASSGLSYADSLAKQGASAKTVAGQIQATRKAYSDAAVSMGASRSEADKLAAAFVKMPKQVTTKIKADVTAAKANLDAAQASVQRYGKNLDDLPASVQTKLIASGGKGAKDEVDKLDQSVRRLPGQAAINTSVPGADGSLLKVKSLTQAAVDADGKVVQIPVSTPNQAAALRALMNINGAAVSADHKSVSIPCSTPLSAQAVRSLENISGVAVSADRKSVSINTSSPGAFEAAQAILGAGNAADRVNGKTAYIKIVTDKITNTIENFEKHNKGFFANGGITAPGGHRVMADGGFSQRQATVAKAGSWITWAEDETGGEAYVPLAASKRARSVALTERLADYFGYDMTKRAADGYASDMASWRSALPAVASSRTVVVAGGGTGGLTNEDRALMRQSIQVSQKVLAAMPAAVESGLSGRRSKDAQSNHLAGRRGN